MSGRSSAVSIVTRQRHTAEVAMGTPFTHTTWKSSPATRRSSSSAGWNGPSGATGRACGRTLGCCETWSTPRPSSASGRGRPSARYAAGAAEPGYHERVARLQELRRALRAADAGAGRRDLAGRPLQPWRRGQAPGHGSAGFPLEIGDRDRVVTQSSRVSGSGPLRAPRTGREPPWHHRGMEAPPRYDGLAEWYDANSIQPFLAAGFTLDRLEEQGDNREHPARLAIRAGGDCRDRGLEQHPRRRGARAPDRRAGARGADDALPRRAAPEGPRRTRDDRGVHELYAHQADAWAAAGRGEHVAVVTGTASGKSLAFNLPVLDALAREPKRRAIYLYPTKALAQDQLRSLTALKVPARPRRRSTTATPRPSGAGRSASGRT